MLAVILACCVEVVSVVVVSEVLLEQRVDNLMSNL